MARKHDRRSALVTSPSTRIGAVPNFKPPRDVNVPVIHTVACPDCKAVISNPCTNDAGLPVPFAHRARRRMAVRLRNQQLGESA